MHKEIGALKIAEDATVLDISNYVELKNNKQRLKNG